jgi:hypothetical protein
MRRGGASKENLNTGEFVSNKHAPTGKTTFSRAARPPSNLGRRIKPPIDRAALAAV